MAGSTSDRIGELVEQWRAERPDLDLDTMALVARLGALTSAWSAAIEAVPKAHGLDLGTMDVLFTLRRAGPPYRLSPGALAAATMVSSGGMTARLDRLERAGLVRRQADPDDRRALLVELTPKARRLTDRLVDEHLARERQLLAGLGDRDRSALDRIVRKGLEHLEQQG